MKTDEDKKEATTKKLKGERNKYFVPNFGEIEASDLDDLEKQVNKLKEKQEAGDGNI
jgi:hypothetical protein